MSLTPPCPKGLRQVFSQSVSEAAGREGADLVEAAVAAGGGGGSGGGPGGAGGNGGGPAGGDGVAAHWPQVLAQLR